MKRKILIIEDNTDIQDIYKTSFEKKGYIVFQSFNGFTGIMDLLHKKPDIILLDIMMPDMDGFEVLSTLMNQSSIIAPIIVVSNLSNESDKQKAIQLGVTKYLVKSDHSVAEIVDQIDRYL